ncbi:hypothetical protein PHLGIDRAFT_178497 [Phlebiopsis gigantea 11061_1 CR5-6]|uniref:Uncharacterized protein n=1 Tax=Phlebiopsis gigantea (strain 11061_1 CR5-6) TaxID=745531 RepID=A0A0C3PGI3_PHLG1|nr:hypothetical protein PHLGIDRAFT_178497 [Phlebiopsis gigantea 11061_1 CR5-6]
MSRRRSDLRSNLSQPEWTALHTEEPLTTTSTSSTEDDILESSQELRDELMSSPTPRPQKRKSRSPRTAAAPHSHKRPRVGPAASSSRSDYVSDDDDVPALAHAKPTRRPPIPSSSNRRNTLTPSKIASAFQNFEKTHGTMPSPSHIKTKVSASGSSSLKEKFPNRHVLRKTLGSKAPQPGRTVHANSTSDLRPKSLHQDQGWCIEHNLSNGPT